MSARASRGRQLAEAMRQAVNEISQSKRERVSAKISHAEAVTAESPDSLAKRKEAAISQVARRTRKNAWNSKAIPVAPNALPLRAVNSGEWWNDLK